MRCATLLSAFLCADTFLSMLALERPLAANFDAAVFEGDAVLAWACRTGAKPGTPPEHDCWTLVSTRGFAERCLAEEAMSAADGGVAKRNDRDARGPRSLSATQRDIMPGAAEGGRTYRPQEVKYLEGEPADAMVAAFRSALERWAGASQGSGGAPEWPRVVHVQCQRWGAARADTDASERLCGDSVWCEAAEEGAGRASFLLDASRALAAGGDFCGDSAGVQDAFLSGAAAGAALRGCLLGAEEEPQRA